MTRLIRILALTVASLCFALLIVDDAAQRREVARLRVASEEPVAMWEGRAMVQADGRMHCWAIWPGPETPCPLKVEQAQRDLEVRERSKRVTACPDMGDCYPHVVYVNPASVAVTTVGDGFYSVHPTAPPPLARYLDGSCISRHRRWLCRPVVAGAAVTARGEAMVTR